MYTVRAGKVGVRFEVVPDVDGVVERLRLSRIGRKVGVGPSVAAALPEGLNILLIL